MDQNDYMQTIVMEFINQRIQATSDVGILILRATTCLMSRLLIIARSSRKIDMKEVIGKYEFATTNRTFMKADGLVYPALDSNKIISILENLPEARTADSSAYVPHSGLNGGSARVSGREIFRCWGQ